MIKLANPSVFLRFAERLLPWLVGLTIVTLAAGLYLSLVKAPADYQQGETVRIMFIHVPSAWLAMAGYGIIALSAFGTLVWRHPLADVSAKAAAPIGAAFTFLALVTGSIWGKPMWGAWWVWDARLTSFLLLFFLYLGLIALWHTIEEPSRAGRITAILALVGSINLPVIKFSVDWWNTLHQPASVIRFDGQQHIHTSILIPLLVMAVGFTLLFTVLHFMAMRNEILRRRVRALMQSRVATHEVPKAQLTDGAVSGGQSS
ncbi:MAG: heme ABC transporter permease [Fimbriimonadaceae bacterium]|nr:heme ABC transporter permease [Alphaproteobacteria bacterium]